MREREREREREKAMNNICYNYEPSCWEEQRYYNSKAEVNRVVSAIKENARP